MSQCDGSQLSGHAAAVVRPHDTVTAKLMYGSAFKAPSPLLLYGSPLGPGDIYGNDELRAQHIHAIEFALAYRPSSAFAIRSSLGHNWLLNKAEFTLQGANRTARNVARVNTLFCELNAKVRREDDAHVFVRLSWQRSRRELSQPGYQEWLMGNRNPAFPTWIGAVGASRAIPVVPLWAGVTALVVSPRLASDSNSIENVGTYELGPYAVLDATVSTAPFVWAGHKPAQASITFKNILDAKGPDPGFSGLDYPLSPRTFMLRFEQEL